ncbi:MAG: SusC/RagA family TonB-linked outer membrane protein, partial [Dysgonamonadaceae bacterium]|nr:SusC/RagA family TonB-linked outer membrane protein [Dysgonamonadaceae bacterium]
AVNKIIKKDEAENLPAYRSEIGYNTDRARGFIYTDIIRTQAELDALLAKYPDYTIRGEKPELGMINYKDIRGVTGDEPDGKITDEDQDWTINHSTPPIVYGFAVGGEWKGLALDLFFQGVSGNDLFINYRDQNARAAKINSIEWDDHWTPDNTDAKYPRAEKPNSKNYPASTFWQRDGSFLRLKHVNLSYAVPKSFLSSLGVSQLKIFYVGANLLLMEDHVKEFDPEFGNVADNWRRYPVMKSHSFGINLSF